MRKAVSDHRLIFLGHLQSEWASDEPTKKTRILIKTGRIPEVHDPFSFSAPPFTGPRRHAMVLYALTDRLTYPQHSRSALLRCAVLAYWFDNGFSRMLVRVPVHGMQGVLGKAQDQSICTAVHRGVANPL
jgi:hypothetical protein